jgi:hypothetical protein
MLLFMCFREITHGEICYIVVPYAKSGGLSSETLFQLEFYNIFILTKIRLRLHLAAVFLRPMKGVIASILTIIYAVFITGSVWTAQEAGDYAVAASGEVFICDDTSREPAKISLAKDLLHVHFGKVVKHLAVGGKNKVPRAGYTPTVFTNFVSDLNPHHSALAIAVEKPALHPNPIYLKNGVLRI